LLATLSALLLGSFGCGTPNESQDLMAARAAMSSAMNSGPGPADNSSIRLNAGDAVAVTFPGAGPMNTTERIRLDGHIAMPLIGDVMAAGKTPKELQDDLRLLYKPHLQNNEVLVILTTSSSAIYVSGAVIKPGRISMERPMTLLDAIMEAGGFDTKKANVKRVAVIRQSYGHQYSRKTFNLRPVLKGKNVEPYQLEPFDIVFVPERIF
jgi:polysaccharide export outer membrane protein